VICNKTIAIRIKFVAFVVICLFVALVGRLYFVQVARHQELFTSAQKKYIATKKTTGKRGEIYDYNGNLLVGNIPCCTVVADPSICGDDEQCKKIALILGKYLDIEPVKIYHDLMIKTMKRKKDDGTDEVVKRRYAHIANNVPLPISDKLKAILKRMKLKGIDFLEKTQRYYPKNELLANILGFTSIDRDQIVANLGIERYFNKVIAPTGGKIKFEISRDGVPLMVRDELKVRDGINIFLTIQEPIQAILEEELDYLMEKSQPRAAYAIMVDPHTGNIMAIAQRPTFNPNDRSTMNANSYRSRITEDTFEPGSTMKPIAISGAIDNGIVTPQTRFDCEKGRWLYCKHWLHDSHPLELLSVAQIIQKSSNIGTAKIAVAMGKELLYNTLHNFGFGQKTGIPLKPETRGRLWKPTSRYWNGLSIVQFPMGQGVSCSPVQLARAYCALANGGRLVGLRLVDRVEVPDTGVTIKYTASPAKRVYRNRSTHRQMIEMMKMVTRTGGTATQAAVPGYEVAGKTGTSQKSENGHYSKTKYFATFVGFVPADDPRFVLLVTADEPKGGYYGGSVAGPTFRKISERTLRYLNVKPTLPIESQIPRR